MDYAYLHHANTVAAFVGSAVEYSILTIDSCFAGANVTLKGHSAGVFRGYARNCYGGAITNCYSLATTKGSTYNGLIGEIWEKDHKIVVSNCYNAKGGVSTHNNAGATSTNNYVTDSTGVSAIKIDVNLMQGLDALTNMPNLNSNDKFVATKSFQKQASFLFSIPGFSNNCSFVKNRTIANHW